MVHTNGEIGGGSPAWDESECLPCMTVVDAVQLSHATDLLDEAGIAYYVKSEDIQNLFGLGSAAFGFNPVTGPPVIMVQASQLEQARLLLGEIDASQSGAADSSASPMRQGMASLAACPHCTKELESAAGDETLTHCYHCGEALQSAGGPKP